jgi:hypothetical protein
MVATTHSRPTHCPNCGVKLPDIPVSLCAYCAMPVGMDSQRESGVESPNAGRIARVLEHEDLADALAFDPPESWAFQRGGQRIWRGKLLLWAGGAALVAGFLLNLGTGGAALVLNVFGVLGGLALAGGAWLVMDGARARRQALVPPLLRRPGIIVDRRSETRIRGWGGDTTYYFSIEFEGGAVGEFEYPGRGSNEDPYVTNLPGVAYTRGTDLLLFRHIRV